MATVFPLNDVRTNENLKSTSYCILVFTCPCHAALKYRNLPERIYNSYEGKRMYQADEIVVYRVKTLHNISDSHMEYLSY